MQYTQIDKGIYRIRLEVRKGLIPFAAQLYALPGERGLLFDAGFGAKKTVARLDKALSAIEADSGQRVREVLPSHAHWDHFSGARPIADARQMTIRLTPEMAGIVRSKKTFREAYLKGYKETPGASPLKQVFSALGRRLTDEFYAFAMAIRGATGPYTPIHTGETITTDSGTWKVIPGPGHCHVHIMLWNQERGILLGGDNVLADITTWLGPPRSDLDAYKETLSMIRDLPGLKVIYPAHGRPVTDPVKRVTDIMNHRKKRLGEIQTKVTDAGHRGLSAEGLVNAYYPGVNPLRKGISRGWIDTTLLYLMKEGTITRSAEKGVWRYRAGEGTCEP